MLVALARIVIPEAHRIPLSFGSLLAFAAICAIAFFATRVRPAYGLAVLIVADPFDFSHAIGPTAITSSKAALIGVALALAFSRASLAPLRTRVTAPLLAGAIAIALATALTAIPGVYIDAVARETLKALEYLTIFIVATIASAADPDDRPVWVALFGVVAIVSLLAILQEFTVAPAALMLQGRTIPRVAGPLEGPNQLAGFFDVALPLLFAWLLAESRSMRARPAPRTLITIGWCALAGALGADLLTLSRAGAIGAVVGLVAVAVVMSDAKMRRPIAIGAAVVAAGTLGALAFLGAFSRMFSTTDVDTAQGLGSRGDLWHAALTFWRANPVLGIGAGNFELDLPQVGLVDVRTHANSLYLQSLAEGGLVLFTATVGTIVVAIRTFLRRAPREALAVGVGAATLGLAAHQILDDLTFFPKVGGFWWLWLGIAAGTVARLEPTAIVIPKSSALRNAAVMALLAAVAIVGAGHARAKRISDIGHPVLETGRRLPIGVAESAFFGKTPESEGLYPAVGPGELCCWLAPNARIPIEAPSGTTRVEVVIFVPTYPFFDRGGQTVDLRIGAARLDLAGLLPGVHRAELPLPAGSRRTWMEIDSVRAFNPKREGFNADTRDLGVILRTLSFR